MASAQELFERFNDMTDGDYDNFQDPTEGDRLINLAYRTAVDVRLKKAGSSKMIIQELKHLYVKNEVQVPTTNELAFTTMDFVPLQMHTFFAKFTDSVRNQVFYNEAINDMDRDGSKLQNPTTRYPQYDWIADRFIITPSTETCTEVMLNYYKELDVLDVTDATDLGFDARLEDDIVYFMCSLAAQPNRDTLLTQLSQNNQNK
jgi:hypothetical protein